MWFAAVIVAAMRRCGRPALAIAGSWQASCVQLAHMGSEARGRQKTHVAGAAPPHRVHRSELASEGVGTVTDVCVTSWLGFRAWQACSQSAGGPGSRQARGCRTGPGVCESGVGRSTSIRGGCDRRSAGFKGRSIDRAYGSVTCRRICTGAWADGSTRCPQLCRSVVCTAGALPTSRTACRRRACFRHARARLF
jgi:hypothetical protein